MDVLPAVTRTLQALPMDDTIGSLKFIERELFGSRAKAAVKASSAAKPSEPLAFEKAGEDATIAAWRAAAASTIGPGPYRNLLDRAELTTEDDQLTITVAKPLDERQLIESYLYRLEPLTHRFLERRLTRIEVRQAA